MYKTIEDTVGNTPLVQLQRLPDAIGRRYAATSCWPSWRATILRDRSRIGRAQLSMIIEAEKLSGQIKEPATRSSKPPAAIPASRSQWPPPCARYRMVLIMPEHLSVERRQTMRAFGAEIVLTPKAGGMETARDVAEKMRDEGRGIILDQFANPDNPLAHYRGTGPEIWRDTNGTITHFVSSMGTTGTIMGVSRFLKEKNPQVNIVGCQPDEGSQIPGIRKWPVEYLPSIYDASRVDRLEYVSQSDAEETARRLAREEGIFAGISSGGACAVALRVAREVTNATIVFIACDRGDRYLSTGVFPV